MNQRSLVSTLTFVLVQASGLPLNGCATDFRDCSAEETVLSATLPPSLSATGLYADIASDRVTDRALEFAPRFELWTDGASKRRWLLLPEGESVNTSDADNWIFPVGTKLFKEFVRDGIRVETRLSMRTEAGWSAISYLWNDAQDEALPVPAGLSDASGTAHDVPDAAQCRACHGGTESFVLGFAAIQFSVEERQRLFERGVISAMVEEEPELPSEVMQGLGYLHANCSHCHNRARSEQPFATSCFTPDVAFDFRFPVSVQTPEEAPAVTMSTLLRTNGIINAVSTRNMADDDPSMPPIGTELVDPQGVAAIQGLIDYFNAL